MIDIFEKDIEEQRLKYNGKSYPNSPKYDNLRLIKHKDIEELVKLFLERNFYKNLHQRTREKPEEKLWSIWFGEKLTYGLVIAPRKNKKEWSNDKSEIRKVNYSYWTVGHVLKEGLIDPDNNTIQKFNTVDDFYKFYSSILKRLSVSQYEQIFYDEYIRYLKSSENVKEEPFLIPELRYAGLNKKHEYRLDFTVFNPHTSEFIGFEISPASSHISVKNFKQKQIQVNDELRRKWDKEMMKRNKYFDNYGITTITFTDEMLKNINACFDLVIKKLKNRPLKTAKLNEQLQRLSSLDI